MGNFKKNALAEAKRIISDLVLENSDGKRFQFEAFIQGLSEEIEDLWESEVKNGIVHFRLVEDGSLIYEGLCTEATVSPTDFYFPIQLMEATLKNVDEDSLDVFTLLSSIKESFHKERSKILENLDQISTDFDKKLIETIRKTKTPSTVKFAEEYLNLDIAAKKQKLLEKLLEGK